MEPERMRPTRWLGVYAVVVSVFVFGGGLFAAGFFTRGLVDENGSAGSASAGSTLADSTSASAAGGELVAALLPEDGITVQAQWGDVMPRLVELGVIDIDKFKDAAAGKGQPLTEEQLAILTQGSDENLRIDADNAYFMVTALWPLGIANKNPILEEGPMAERGWENRGNYAATGGWRLGKQPGGEYVSAFEILPLTPEQQAIAEEVAYNSYRPCCGNSTGFPDCNHGAAALGLAYLMASQGASADDIFEAVKGFNSFWFPQQYHTLARYFEQQGESWSEVDARTVVGKEHSSSSGYKQVQAALQPGGEVPQAGAASGC